MTPAGIELVTFRFVAQHLNHCATAVPNTNKCTIIFTCSFIHNGSSNMFQQLRWPSPGKDKQEYNYIRNSETVILVLVLMSKEYIYIYIYIIVQFKHNFFASNYN